MPYCKTSYETAAGRIQKLTQLEKALKEALVTGMLPERRLGVLKNGQESAVFVIGGSTDEMHIPPFIHPYLIQNFKGQDFLVTDLRLFRSTNQEWISDKEFENSVRNKTEYALAKSRAVLGLLWLDESQRSRIRSRFSFACSVFAAWLSQAIAKSYALDFQEQMRLQAVAIYYYFTLFTENTKLEGDDLETAVVHTIKATKFPATEVYALFEAIGDMGGIEDFCVEAQKAIQNVRLQNFNLPMLMTLIANTWYGTNSKDMLAVALEYPPTWISIVYSTLTERTYKSSGLYRLVEMTAKRGNADEFRMNYIDLFKDRVLTLESADNEIVFRDFEE